MKPVLLSIYISLFIVKPISTFSQPQVLCEIKNCVQTQPNEVEFEYWLTNMNTSGITLQLSAVTFSLNYNAAINGLFANSFGSLVSLNPALGPAMLASTNVCTNPSIGYMRYNSGIELQSNAITIPQSPGIMFAKFKITSSLPFVSPTPLDFIFQSTNLGVKVPNRVIAFIGSNANSNGLNWTDAYCPIVVTNPCNNIYNAVNNVTTCNSYTWPLNGITYTSSGTYTNSTPIIGTPCFTYDLLNLTIPNVFNITNATTCGSYTWNVNNITYTTSGSYTVPNTSNPCNYDVLNLTILPNINSMVTAQSINSCAGVPLDLTSSVSPSGGTFNVNPSTAYIPPLGVSNYTYTYFDSTLNCFGTANGTINSQPFSTITGFINTSLTNSNAGLSWNSSPFALWYTIRYRIQGSSNWIYVSTVNVSFVLQNLNSATTYEAQIRGNCYVTSAGVYSSSIVFTTL